MGGYLAQGPVAVTATSHHVLLVTAINADQLRKPPRKDSRKLMVGTFSRTSSAHLASAQSPRASRFHAPFTQHIRALWRVTPCGMYQFGLSARSPPKCAVTAQIAHSKYANRHAPAAGSHFWFAPSTRSWCEPGRRPVIKSYGCQALVSTVVSTKRRRSDWQPLEIAAHCLKVLAVSAHLPLWKPAANEHAPSIQLHSFSSSGGEGYAINGSSACGRGACCASARP